MAKKKRKGHQHGKASAVAQRSDKETLAREAQQALQQGRFRDAIAHCKARLKQEDTVQARQQLADAYEGRAAALSDKGMYKEALVIWENRRALGADVAPLRLPYADVLLRLDKADEVAALLSAGEGALSRAERDGLRARLAAYSLGGHAEIRHALPEDDPLQRHLEAAEAALEAYCHGDDTALAQALAAIPFRSPCRDLAQILKALQRLETAPEDARERLAKVPTDSAFAPLRQAAELACLPESEVMVHLHDASEATRRFVLTLRGWDDKRQAMHQALHALGPTPSSKALFKLMYRYQDTLGRAWVEEYSLRLLVAQFPGSVEWLRQERPVQPPEYDLLRLVLWYVESDQSASGDILDCQEKLADVLRMQAPQEPGSDSALRLALVLKRFDDNFRVLDEPPTKGPDSLDGYVAERVEESLDYDPDDLDTYLRLHAYYLRGNQLKQARHFQAEALRRWPEDIRVLTAALDTAVASHAFKKAAKLAHQILAIDPINRGARERLVKAHLAHATKQLRAKRPDLAENELADAMRWDTQARFSARIEIIAALIEAQHAPASGAARVAEVHKRQGGGLAAHFNLALEMEAAGIPPAKLGQRFGIKKPHPQSTEDVVAFVARLQEQLTEDKISQAIKRHFKTPVKTLAYWPMEFESMLHICELLKRCDWQAPRLALARQGVKEWKAPVFELHAFEAKYPKKHFLASEHDIHCLDAAERRATEAGDIRTAARINEILSGFRFLGMGGGPPSFFDDDPFGDASESPFEPASAMPVAVDAVLTELRQHGLEALCDTLGLDEKSRKLFRNIEREVGIEGLAALLAESFPEDGSFP